MGVRVSLSTASFESRSCFDGFDERKKVFPQPTSQRTPKHAETLVRP